MVEGVRIQIHLLHLVCPESVHDLNVQSLEKPLPQDSIHPEVALLREQLNKLDLSNGRLQG